MALKVIHIDRQALNREAEAKAFWGNVLKPKLERRARERGGKLMMILKTKENTLRQGFSFNKETSIPGEILEIVIEVDGNKLNIRHRTKKKQLKTVTKKVTKLVIQKYPLTFK
jgi:hypothetical protein